MMISVFNRLILSSVLDGPSVVAVLAQYTGAMIDYSSGVLFVSTRLLETGMQSSSESQAIATYCGRYRALSITRQRRDGRKHTHPLFQAIGYSPHDFHWEVSFDHDCCHLDII
ncbi:hypothetical protein BU24DRAFT_51980 [Aaosphaeria arxii CBS 175.79]|uniref:Uncharacterized protein n=1 Tax=Aaosphaeria arxii CBS 175.79 TaxID=1450172 RepID=A0A6A5XDH2_9PLEO|nr:uncharacterized protein BU24DRAFT_51980 [Aaosphaeria arxii CBS 175.79]KAF2011048.1 hypothetical protein BU24DRAFT_51980 [Aaosphaeria arxii CBS 175.79]